MFKKKFPSLSSLGSDGNTAFLRAARAGHLDKVLEHLKANIDINTSNTNGLNALHLASKDGHVPVVTELLKRGAAVDSATKKGNTALHIASLAGQEEVVKLLVATGAAVNVQSQNGFTPLYMAAQENHDNVVKFLLANGANQSLATEDGFTPLAVAMQQGHDKVVAVLLENDTRGKVRLPALHIAAKKDDCKAAALLLQNEHNPDVTSKSGFTPLHIAAHYGNEGIANLLLTRGADVNYSAKHNISPLHVAAKWGKTNLVSLLLEKGATIESKTRDGLTPLHCAARSGHEQVVDMMLERQAPISSKTKNGLAPLHMAAQGDHVDAARILLYHRAPVDEVTVDYLTALHVAAHCGHVRVAKLLLDRKADPNARALNGFTPLHIACKKNRIKVVELLLKHGGSIEATTESGLTPLHVASFMGCMNIVIFLLQNDASPDVPTVRGETPLHLAARANQTDIIRILLRNGAQVDARAREQQTPLHIASRLGNVDIVMLLLQHGAAVDSTTKDMYTALHIAAKEGQEEVASVLLENGASLTSTTKKGFTPLHLASKYGNIKVAKLLLQKEAPVDAQGKNGVTPLHVASHYDHQNVALLLLDKGASPHATAKNGHTPLHIAARKNQMDIATTLLEYNAKANAESKAGFTPLHLSAQEGHTDMSTLLIEHQADTNHNAKNGLTPLHLCAQEDRVNVSTILVKNGAQVDSTTKGGYTPLHVASHFGQVNMVRFLTMNGADVGAATAAGYTPLHQAAQQGHATTVQLLLDKQAPPNAQTTQGQTPLCIAQKLGYISVVESLKGVTDPVILNGTSGADDKYRVVAPETMQETFMSDSEEEGGEDNMLSDQPYRYLTVDEMKSLGDDSLPIDVTRDERMDSNRECMAPPQAMDDTISPQHVKESYSQFAANFTPDNVDISRHPINVGKLHWKNFLVSFLVDARGGAMRGCRHSGVRVIVPPRKASQPMRVTCRYLKRDKLTHPPPLMEGEALASRILELGPVGAKFLGPVIIEVPHFGSLRGAEREIVVLRSDNGETWREHTLEASDEAIHDVLNESFEADEISALEDSGSGGRTTRILTADFPQYFAIVSRVRQEVHAIGPEGGMVSSSVVPQVQAVFPPGALTKKIKVGLQAQPISAELAAKLLGNRVAVSPIVTVEPRRRKFHKPITLTIPVPQAANKGMINQYSGEAPTLRLLCSITGGTTRAQWEDVTGSTPLTFVNDCVSFTTTVSARFWLMDCRNIAEATKMATELYREAIHVPFMAKFVVFAKRTDVLEARLRVFCMTDDKEDKTLEHQEHFTEVAKSRDVEVLEGKPQYVEFAGNLIPVTKSGDQLQLGFRAFRENRLPFTVRVKDPHADMLGRVLFMREARVAKGEPPQQPICILNIVLPEDIVPEPSIVEADIQALNKKYSFLRDGGLSRLESYQRPDLRLTDVSNLIGSDWEALASDLGVADADVEGIKAETSASAAQQAMTMLRLWLAQAGNKANGNTLDTSLRRIGRADVADQCTFKVKSEQLRDVSYRRNISLDAAFDERDIMKESESVEELTRAERGRVHASKRREDSDDGESKYVGEEKVVVEEQRSVSQLKEIFAQDKRDRQYERQPSVGSDRPSRPTSVSERSLMSTIATSDERPASDADIVERTASTETEPESFTVEEIRQKFSSPQPESIISVTKLTKKTSETEHKTPEPAKKSGIPSLTKSEGKDGVSKTREITSKTETITQKIDGVPTKNITESSETKTEIIKASGIPRKTSESPEVGRKSALPKVTTKTTVVETSSPKSDVISTTTSEVTVTTKASGIPVVTKTTKVVETVIRTKGDESSDKLASDQRRDSELFQGVSEELGRLETTFKVVPAEEGVLSPKVSKTPPPSPAEFNREASATSQSSWSASGTLSTELQPTTHEWSEKSDSAKDSMQSDSVVKTGLNPGPIVVGLSDSEPSLIHDSQHPDPHVEAILDSLTSFRNYAYVDMSRGSSEHSVSHETQGNIADIVKSAGVVSEDHVADNTSVFTPLEEEMIGARPDVVPEHDPGRRGTYVEMDSLDELRGAVDRVKYPGAYSTSRRDTYETIENINVLVENLAECEKGASPSGREFFHGEISAAGCDQNLSRSLTGEISSKEYSLLNFLPELKGKYLDTVNFNDQVEQEYVLTSPHLYENTTEKIDIVSDLSQTKPASLSTTEVVSFPKHSGTLEYEISGKIEKKKDVLASPTIAETMSDQAYEPIEPTVVLSSTIIRKKRGVDNAVNRSGDNTIHGESLPVRNITPAQKPAIPPKPAFILPKVLKSVVQDIEVPSEEATPRGFFVSLLSKKPTVIGAGGSESRSQGSAQLEEIEATVERILSEVALHESLLPDSLVSSDPTSSPKNAIQGPSPEYFSSEMKSPVSLVNTWEAGPDGTTVIELLPRRSRGQKGAECFTSKSMVLISGDEREDDRAERKESESLERLEGKLIDLLKIESEGKSQIDESGENIDLKQSRSEREDGFINRKESEALESLEGKIIDVLKIESGESDKINETSENLEEKLINLLIHETDESVIKEKFKSSECLAELEKNVLGTIKDSEDETSKEKSISLAEIENEVLEKGLIQVDLGEFNVRGVNLDAKPRTIQPAEATFNLNQLGLGPMEEAIAEFSVVGVETDTPNSLETRLESRKKLKKTFSEETKPEQNYQIETTQDISKLENPIAKLESSVEKLLTELKEDEMSLYLFDTEDLVSVPSRESSSTTEIGDRPRFSSEESDDMWWDGALRQRAIPVPGSQAAYWESVRLDNLSLHRQRVRDRHDDARNSMMAASSHEERRLDLPRPCDEARNSIVSNISQEDRRRTSTGDEGDLSSLCDGDDERSMKSLSASREADVRNDPMFSNVFASQGRWSQGNSLSGRDPWSPQRQAEEVDDDGNISRILANFPSSLQAKTTSEHGDDGRNDNAIWGKPSTSRGERFDEGNISRILANFPASSALTQPKSETSLETMNYDEKMAKSFTANQSNTLPRTSKLSQINMDQPISMLFIRSPGYDPLHVYTRTPSTQSLNPEYLQRDPIRKSSKIVPVLQHLKKELSYDPDDDTDSDSSSTCSSPDYFAAPPLRFPSLQHITRTTAVPLTGPPILAPLTSRSYITAPTSLPTTPRPTRRRSPITRSSSGHSNSPSPGYNIASPNLQNLPPLDSLASLMTSSGSATSFFASHPYYNYKILSPPDPSPDRSYLSSQSDLRPSPIIPSAGYCDWSSQSDSRESTPRGGDASGDWGAKETASSVKTTTTTTTTSSRGSDDVAPQGAIGGVTNTITTTETRVVEGSDDMQELLEKLAAERHQ